MPKQNTPIAGEMQVYSNSFGRLIADDKVILLRKVTKRIPLSRMVTYPESEIEEHVSMVIDVMLEEKTVYTVTGRKGTGKSTGMLRLARAVALGEPYYGHQCVQSPVLWVAAENPDGTEKSLLALCRQFGDKEPPPVYIVSKRLTVEQIRDEATYIGAKLIIIDSLQAMFVGEDANSNKDMLDLAEKLRVCTSGPTHPALLAIAHPVKHQVKGEPEPYGGGSLSNSLDGNWGMTRDAGSGLVTLSPGFKVRGERFEPITFVNYLRPSGKSQFGSVIHRPVALTEAEYNELMGAPSDIANMVPAETMAMDHRAVEVLRLHQQGLSQDKIAKQLRKRKSEVGKIIKGGL